MSDAKMEVVVAERGQITLPKPVRDALGLTKGMTLKVEIQNGRIILRKDVSEAISRVRGRFKDRATPTPTDSDQLIRDLRGRAPDDALAPFETLRDDLDDLPGHLDPAGHPARN